MKNLFNPDNPVMHVLGLVGYSIWLNLLWALCCLPVLTIGASTTALYYASGKLVRGESGSATSFFFSGFRSNFKQTTGIWLILLAVGAVLGADGYILYHLRLTGPFWAILTALFVGALILYAVILLWIFPLLSAFENTTRLMFKNALALGIRYAACTLLMAGIYGLMGFLIVSVFTPLLFLGFGLCAMACSALLKRIFQMLAETASVKGTENG